MVYILQKQKYVQPKREFACGNYVRVHEFDGLIGDACC